MISKAKKFIKRIELNNKQRKLNRLYERDGLTEEVVDKQVEINTLRHEHDIPDNGKKVFREFVQ